MSADPMDEFLSLYVGSEPVGPAAPEPEPSAPPAAVEVPAASAPAVVPDVTNVSVESALAEVIRRVQAIEVYLRRNGADL